MALPHWLFPRSRSFGYGVMLPFQALGVIARNPVLIVLSLIPVGVTITIYSYIISYLQSSAKEFLNQSFLSWGWDPQGFAAGVILLFSKLVLLLVGALTFSFVAGVASSPFNDFLAEKTEPCATPPLPAVASVPLFVKIQLVGIDLLKTIGAGVASFIALLLSWVPIVNLVAFVITFLLVTFQFTSYPQTRRGIGLREGIRFLLTHPFACAGFGGSLTILFAIPLVSVVFLPAAVVGGTLLVARAQPSRDFPRLR